MPVEAFDQLDRLDIAIDGADQVAPDHWLVKGGGGAHTREKIVAAAGRALHRDRRLLQDRRSDLRPDPPRAGAFGLASTLARISAELGEVALAARHAGSPDGGVIADFRGKVHEPGSSPRACRSMPGVVDHGLFPSGMVSAVLIGRGDAVERA